MFCYYIYKQKLRSSPGRFIPLSRLDRLIIPGLETTRLFPKRVMEKNSTVLSLLPLYSITVILCVSLEIDDVKRSAEKIMRTD